MPERLGESSPSQLNRKLIRVPTFERLKSVVYALIPNLKTSMSTTPDMFRKLHNPLELCETVDELGLMLIGNWGKLVASGDPHLVASEYLTTDEGFGFLPTLDPTHVKNRLGVITYFGGKEHPEKPGEKIPGFLDKQPVLHNIDSITAVFSGEMLLTSGLYTFKLGSGDIVPARYSFAFTWKGKDQGWKIIHHHSSLAPQGH